MKLFYQAIFFTCNLVKLPIKNNMFLTIEITRVGLIVKHDDITINE